MLLSVLSHQPPVRPNFTASTRKRPTKALKNNDLQTRKNFAEGTFANVFLQNRRISLKTARVYKIHP